MIKKIYSALLGMAALAMVVACGGSKSPAPAIGNEKVDEVVEKAFRDMSGMEKFASVLKDAYQLEVKDVAPVFEYKEQNEKGKDYFYGNDNENKQVSCVYVKKDGGEITEDEYKAYVKKIYDLMKSKSQDGKLIRGFDGGAEKLEEALEEKSFEKLFENKLMPQDFCYRMGDVFFVCTMSLEEPKQEMPYRIKFSNARGLQKSLNASMEDVEKALDDPEVQKVIKEKLGN